MKIILMKAVDNLGEKDDVVEVADGYARNYLIPQGMAVRATAENLNELELRRKAEQREEKRERKKFSAKAEEIDGYNLMLTVRAGEEGKLFGSVTTLDIANGVEEGLGVEIDRRSVMLEEPIKELGTYSVTIKLYDDITADIKVDVMAER